MNTDLDFLAEPTPAPAQTAIRERQMAFINDLRQDWLRAEDELARLQNRAPKRPAWKDPADFSAASAMIDAGKAARTEIRKQLTNARRAARAASNRLIDELTEGLYVIGDDITTAYIYKIQTARNGSGQLYAKVLGPEGWEYVGRQPLYDIAHEGHRMLADEAAWLGKDASSPLAGECANCSRALTDETSLYYGYGEICAGRNGWPYVKGAERA